MENLENPDVGPLGVGLDDLWREENFSAMEVGGLVEGEKKVSGVGEERSSADEGQVGRKSRPELCTDVDIMACDDTEGASYLPTLTSYPQNETIKTEIKSEMPGGSHIEMSISDNEDKERQPLSYELQQGYRIMSEIMSDGNKSLNWPFMDPVDAEAMELPDYYDRIKEPMWLKKIHMNFEERSYGSITEFAHDFRLMLENCYRYNGPDHYISKRGQKLETVFEQKLSLLSRELRVKTSRAATSGKPVEDQMITGTRRRKVQAPQDSSELLNQLRQEEKEREREQRRNQVEERRQQQLAFTQDLIDWDEKLLGEGGKDRLEAMWELPQIGHFLFLCSDLMNLGEVMQWELERSFWMPRQSSTLHLLMTSLLSTPYQRTRLDTKPPMPYNVWEEKLRGRVKHWYKVYNEQNRDTKKTHMKLGLDERFFKILGVTNPLETRQFHQLTYYQRIWVTKGLCDWCLETQESVREAFESVPIDETREYYLGRDAEGNTYLHFPQFCGQDLRVYRRAPIDMPKIDRPKPPKHKDKMPSPPKKKRKHHKAKPEPPAPQRARSSRLRQNPRQVSRSPCPSDVGDVSESDSGISEVDRGRKSVRLRQSRRTHTPSPSPSPASAQSTPKSGRSSRTSAAARDWTPRDGSAFSEVTSSSAFSAVTSASAFTTVTSGRMTRSQRLTCAPDVILPSGSSTPTTNATPTGSRSSTPLTKDRSSRSSTPSISSRSSSPRKTRARRGRRGRGEEEEGETEIKREDEEMGKTEVKREDEEMGKNDIKMEEGEENIPEPGDRTKSESVSHSVSGEESHSLHNGLPPGHLNHDPLPPFTSYQTEHDENIDKTKPRSDSQIDCDTSTKLPNLDSKTTGRTRQDVNSDSTGPSSLTERSVTDRLSAENGNININDMRIKTEMEEEGGADADMDDIKCELSSSVNGEEWESFMNSDGFGATLNHDLLSDGLNHTAPSDGLIHTTPSDGLIKTEPVTSAEGEADATTEAMAEATTKAMAEATTKAMAEATTKAGLMEGLHCDHIKEEPGESEGVKGDGVEMKEEPGLEVRGAEAALDIKQDPQDEILPEIQHPEIGPFKLVADSVDKLKQLTLQFAEPEPIIEIKGMKEKILRPPPRKRCVSELYERLSFLLSELEPWESKLLAANKKARIKLRKEYESYIEDTEPKKEEVEDVWESEEEQTEDEEEEESEEESDDGKEEIIEIKQEEVDQKQAQPSVPTPLPTTKPKTSRRTPPPPPPAPDLPPDGLEAASSSDSPEKSMFGRIRKRKVIPNSYDETPVIKKKKGKDVDGSQSTGPNILQASRHKTVPSTNSVHPLQSVLSKAKPITAPTTLPSGMQLLNIGGQTVLLNTNTKPPVILQTSAPLNMNNLNLLTQLSAKAAAGNMLKNKAVTPPKPNPPPPKHSPQPHPAPPTSPNIPQQVIRTLLAADNAPQHPQATPSPQPKPNKNKPSPALQPIPNTQPTPTPQPTPIPATDPTGEGENSLPEVEIEPLPLTLQDAALPTDPTQKLERVQYENNVERMPYYKYNDMKQIKAKIKQKMLRPGRSKSATALHNLILAGLLPPTETQHEQTAFLTETGAETEHQQADLLTETGAETQQQASLLTETGTIIQQQASLLTETGTVIQQTGLLTETGTETEHEQAGDILPTLGLPTSEPTTPTTAAGMTIGQVTTAGGWAPEAGLTIGEMTTAGVTIESDGLTIGDDEASTTSVLSSSDHPAQSQTHSALLSPVKPPLDTPDHPTMGTLSISTLPTTSPVLASRPHVLNLSTSPHAFSTSPHALSTSPHALSPTLLPTSTSPPALSPSMLPTSPSLSVSPTSLSDSLQNQAIPAEVREALKLNEFHLSRLMNTSPGLVRALTSLGSTAHGTRPKYANNVTVKSLLESRALRQKAQQGPETEPVKEPLSCVRVISPVKSPPNIVTTKAGFMPIEGGEPLSYVRVISPLKHQASTAVKATLSPSGGAIKVPTPSPVKVEPVPSVLPQYSPVKPTPVTPLQLPVTPLQLPVTPLQLPVRPVRHVQQVKLVQAQQTSTAKAVPVQAAVIQAGAGNPVQIGTINTVSQAGTLNPVQGGTVKVIQGAGTVNTVPQAGTINSVQAGTVNPVQAGTANPVQAGTVRLVQRGGTAVQGAKSAGAATVPLRLQAIRTSQGTILRMPSGQQITLRATTPRLPTATTPQNINPGQLRLQTGIGGQGQAATTTTTSVQQLLQQQQQQLHIPAAQLQVPAAQLQTLPAAQLQTLPAALSSSAVAGVCGVSQQFDTDLDKAVRSVVTSVHTSLPTAQMNISTPLSLTGQHQPLRQVTSTVSAMNSPITACVPITKVAQSGHNYTTVSGHNTDLSGSITARPLPSTSSNIATTVSTLTQPVSVNSGQKSVILRLVPQQQAGNNTQLLATNLLQQVAATSLAANSLQPLATNPAQLPASSPVKTVLQHQMIRQTVEEEGSTAGVVLQTGVTPVSTSVLLSPNKVHSTPVLLQSPNKVHSTQVILQSPNKVKKTSPAQGKRTVKTVYPATKPGQGGGALANVTTKPGQAGGALANLTTQLNSPPPSTHSISAGAPQTSLHSMMVSNTTTSPIKPLQLPTGGIRIVSPQQLTLSSAGLVPVQVPLSAGAQLVNAQVGSTIGTITQESHRKQQSQTLTMNAAGEVEMKLEPGEVKEEGFSSPPLLSPGLRGETVHVQASNSTGLPGNTVNVQANSSLDLLASASMLHEAKVPLNMPSSDTNSLNPTSPRSHNQTVTNPTQYILSPTKLELTSSGQTVTNVVLPPTTTPMTSPPTGLTTVHHQQAKVLQQQLALQQQLLQEQQKQQTILQQLALQQQQQQKVVTSPTQMVTTQGGNTVSRVLVSPTAQTSPVSSTGNPVTPTSTVQMAGIMASANGRMVQLRFAVPQGMTVQQLLQTPQFQQQLVTLKVSAIHGITTSTVAVTSTTSTSTTVAGAGTVKTVPSTVVRVPAPAVRVPAPAVSTNPVRAQLALTSPPPKPLINNIVSVSQAGLSTAAVMAAPAPAPAPVVLPPTASPSASPVKASVVGSGQMKDKVTILLNVNGQLVQAQGLPLNTPTANKTRILIPGSAQTQLVNPGPAQARIVNPVSAQAQLVSPGSAQAQLVSPVSAQTRLVTPAQARLVSQGNTQVRLVSTASAQAGLVSPGSAQVRLVSPGSAQARLVNAGSLQTGLVSPGTGQVRLVSPGTGQVRLVSPGTGQVRLVSPGTGQVRLVSPGSAQARLVSSGTSHVRLVSPGTSQVRLVSPGTSQVRLVSPGTSPVRLVSPGSAQARLVSPVTAQARLVSPAQAGGSKVLSLSAVQQLAQTSPAKSQPTILASLQQNPRLLTAFNKVQLTAPATVGNTGLVLAPQQQVVMTRPATTTRNAASVQDQGTVNNDRLTHSVVTVPSKPNTATSNLNTATTTLPIQGLPNGN